MRRSTRSRRPTGNARTKRLLAVGATLAVFGGVVAVTQISSAGDRRSNQQQRPVAAECVAPSPGATAPAARGATTTRTWQNGRWVVNHWGDGQQTVEECQETRDGTDGATDGAFAVACPDVVSRLPQVPDRARAEVDRNLNALQTQITEADERLAAEGDRGEGFIRNAILNPLASKRRATIGRITIAIDRFGPRPRGLGNLATCQVQPVDNNNGGNDGGNNNGGNDGDNDGGNNNNGLDVLANNCDNSQLQAHDGFQNGNRCISTAFGEVGAAANNPSLLITDFPQQINRNEGFSIQVSTRNLVRDRFLPAGQGGYYLESSLLNGEGLTRGHFHTACRMLNNTDEAPAPEPVPAFFVATEDGGGGAQPDQVTIQIPGLPDSGTAQCAVWAGDGSHRIPMSERANQTPAFDAVRIQVN
ncbi:hypothetical protein ACN26Z_14210 [Verrucosispora sp. WMMD703]|uniref:hypothetical protein n=1 Tax=unclassified Micromonospora TaxID=2617518 RepID=UPI00249B323B|nr:hypothetical protein [Verrucosispora sp. WMMD1129]WFE43406.1 hypothetical protein O7624_03255 [Verrucosispora sp. WMMD1129]